MNDHPTKNTIKATGYFNAKGANIAPFNSESVKVENVIYLVIEGSTSGIPHDGRTFWLNMHLDTPPGEYKFPGDGKIRHVQYQDIIQMVSAQSGTFNVNLDHDTKRYRITFNLYFGPRLGNIEGDIDVSV